MPLALYPCDNRLVATCELTYAEVGATDPAAASWTPGPRRFETTVRVGEGEPCWNKCRADVLGWAVKTRSGFRVAGGSGRVEGGHDYQLIFGIGPVAVREPIRIVAVVDELDRCGFAYGTLPGHPVSGEEAFIIHRDTSGTVSVAM